LAGDLDDVSYADGLAVVGVFSDTGAEALVVKILEV
jgi:hypothetical protein